MENLKSVKKKPQVEDIMINTTFVMADAIDILLRNAERRMYKKSKEVISEFVLR